MFDYFPEVTEAVDRLARDGLDAAAAEAATVAKGAGADRGLTEIDVVPAHGDLDGWVSGVKAPFYYRYQSYGTLGKALRSKRPGNKRSHAPGTGIAPNRMFQLARTAGRRKLLEHVRRGLS